MTDAMAMGLVCVGSDHCDIPEAILDGQTGFLAPESDVRAFTEALRALDVDRPRLVEMAWNGRQHIERKFNLQTQLGEMSAFYWALAR